MHKICIYSLSNKINYNLENALLLNTRWKKIGFGELPLPNEYPDANSTGFVRFNYSNICFSFYSIYYRAIQVSARSENK